MNQRYCQREGCGKPIPTGRRKYCCDECCTIANRANERAREREEIDCLRRRQRERSKAKLRVCLRCGDEFLSWGPGNRRCAKCKRALEAGVSGWPRRVHVPDAELAGCLEGRDDS